MRASSMITSRVVAYQISRCDLACEKLSESRHYTGTYEDGTRARCETARQRKHRPTTAHEGAEGKEVIRHRSPAPIVQPRLSNALLQ